MKRVLLASMLLMLGLMLKTRAVRAQTDGDVLGAHNLSVSGTGPVKGNLDPCLFCHAPHSGVQNSNPALWSQTLSVQTYTPYSSTTLHNLQQQPALGAQPQPAVAEAPSSEQRPARRSRAAAR